MGSALTFPIESFVFATLCIIGIESQLKRQLTTEEVSTYFGRVRVYGDDIIVPTEFVISVINTLEAYGLKVNHHKSFWTGKFRESCGGDFYAGHDIKVVKVGRKFPNNRGDVEDLVSTVELRNRLASSRYTDFPSAVDYLDTLLCRIIPMPEVSRNSMILGRVVPFPQPTGYCEKRFIPLVKGCFVSYDYRVDRLDGHGALMKFFLKQGKPRSKDHLYKAGRPISSHIKYGWAPLN